MGTPDFAVNCLEALCASKHEVVEVFTQTDKPVGRKREIKAPAVKQCALKHGLAVFQPETLRSDKVMQEIQNLNPDIIVVVAYGKILPNEILSYPKYGCVNIHGSLLPKYRGAAPIQWSIINGEKLAGVTSMFMDEGLDTGAMLVRQATEIGENETAGELYDRLKHMGAQVLIKTLEGIENGSLTPERQDENKMTLAPMLTKENSSIDFGKTALQVHNLIRGLNPWPVANTRFCGRILKIYTSKISDLTGTVPGEVVSADPLVVSCAGGTTIELKEVQLEGKRRMSAADFSRGAHIKPGDTLG